jgi:hypothetical protein
VLLLRERRRRRRRGRRRLPPELLLSLAFARAGTAELNADRYATVSLLDLFDALYSPGRA